MGDTQTARWVPIRLPSRRELTAQLRATAPVLVVATVFTAAAFVVVSYLHFDERVLAYQLIDDPAPFAGLASYTGLLSYLGVLAWCAAATVCGFCGALLWRVGQARELSRFLLILAGLNVWMMLDDLLILHEDLAEWLVGFESRHVGEGLFFLAYLIIVSICFVRFREIVMRSDYLLLAAGAVSFGISTALDVALQLEMGGNNPFLEVVVSRSWGGPLADISEELLKLNGVLLWFAYLARLAFGGVREAMRHPATAVIEHQSNRPPATKRRRPKHR